MTLTNRLLNRTLLLVLGLACLAAAVVVAAPFAPGALTEQAWMAWLGGVPALPALDSRLALLAVLAGAVLVLAVCLPLILTRGRGRTSIALVADGLSLDDDLVEQMVRHSLAGQPDVLAVGAQAYRRDGGVVLVRIEARSRANLSWLLDSVRGAIADLDTSIGRRLPVDIHDTTGIRTATTGSRLTT